MYGMMNSFGEIRLPAVSANGPARNLRGRTSAAVDPISLAGAPRRAGVRRPEGSPRICGARTSCERRCAYR